MLGSIVDVGVMYGIRRRVKREVLLILFRSGFPSKTLIPIPYIPTLVNCIVSSGEVVTVVDGYIS